MFLFHCLFYHLLVKGIFSMLTDIYIDKMLMGAKGVFNYIFFEDEPINIAQEVSFHLYTKQNLHVSQVLPHNFPEIVRLSNFNPKLPTIFIIHGYTDHKDREIVQEFRVALMHTIEDSNVIVADWGRLAAFIYATAVEHTVIVGQFIGQFLELLERHFIDLRTVHLIGQSLGAHVCGIAGAHVRGRVGRITGLDPAALLYEIVEERDASLSLDRSDAVFVDVIHTDIGEFGIQRAVGHADFYPNGGTSPQPGCDDPLTMMSCSHLKSTKFYMASIFDKSPFEARHCNVTYSEDKCLEEEPVYMGHYVSPKARGVYFLETGGGAPYVKRGLEFSGKC